MSNQPHSPHDPDEVGHQDDAVIGRAFRWSAIVLVLVLVVILGVIFYVNRPEAKGPEQNTAIAAPVVPDKPRAQIPRVRFTDITDEAGITFVHNNGATGEKLLPESLGGGVAFLDFDNDGDDDLLFINSTWWPWDLARDASRKPTTAALYRNDAVPGGGVKFTDVTAGSGLDVPVYGMGAACGDFDNDGLVDVLLTCVGENRLFRNLGNGKFADVTTKAGVAGDAGDWSTAATFLDFDNDGHLDLFVANYVKWSREIDFKVNFTIDGTHRAYGPPTDFEGAFPRLYRNNGDGTFADVSEASGVQMKNKATGVPVAKSLGVAVVDINSDGHIDLLVANDTTPNQLFVNQGDGTFKEQGAIAGVAFDSNGNTRGAMGIDIARHRNNADLGIAIGNFANEMTALYVSQGQPMLFADEAIAEGIGPASRLPLKFGIFFFDYDLNAWPDLLTVNGHLDEDITRVQASQEYRQPAQLFWNNGGNGFLLVSANEAGTDLFQPIVGRSSAYADIDGDGDLDVVLTQLHGPPLLLRNDQSLGHHWLKLKLAGTKSNRDAIGAIVTLTAGGVTQQRTVTPTRSYLSQSSCELVFGLGEADKIDALNIRWPSGAEANVAADKLGVNQRLVVTE
ncbi:MAG TPA: CRTAC1 family protein [Verrucomicrobiales bacterium]|nr:CRTAC1 family protein [Verrucomicrobiales bacterium]